MTQYEKKALWEENIPFNSSRSKYDDLVLTKAPLPILYFNLARWIFGKKVMKDNHGHDDFVDRQVIQKGRARETYEDCPMITPYIVPDCKTSVVIAPGGGFCDRTDKQEGSDVAAILNSHGISAFVVEYRLEPYRFPIPCLDIQRAVRWVRHHAVQYGVPKDSVGVMGFSAGGYAVAGAAILLGDSPVSAEGYIPDAIDEEKGMPDYVCPIYPVVSFDVNPCMLANLLGPEFYTDAAKRRQWQEDYNLSKQIHRAEDIPFFLAYGTKDPLGGFEEFAEKLNERPTQNHVLVLKGATHGFILFKKWAGWWDECISWIKGQ